MQSQHKQFQLEASKPEVEELVRVRDSDGRPEKVPVFLKGNIYRILIIPHLEEIKVLFRRRPTNQMIHLTTSEWISEIKVSTVSTKRAPSRDILTSNRDFSISHFTHCQISKITSLNWLRSVSRSPTSLSSTKATRRGTSLGRTFTPLTQTQFVSCNM